jgi:hypothetical protein
MFLMESLGIDRGNPWVNLLSLYLYLVKPVPLYKDRGYSLLGYRIPSPIGYGIPVEKLQIRREKGWQLRMVCSIYTDPKIGLLVSSALQGPTGMDNDHSLLGVHAHSYKLPYSLFSCLKTFSYQSS